MRLVLVLSLLLLAGCPPETPAPPATPPAPPPTATPFPGWVKQAEKVTALLDEVVACVEKGDKPGALKARERAYFEAYENVNANLEVASKRHLPMEPFEGKMKNVVVAREDAFGQIKTLIQSGAPATKVREVAGELGRKIQEDAKKLDEMRAPPP